MPRRIPALITYLHPFYLVEGEGIEPWRVTIDDVNRAAWDYVKLHEVVGALDVGLDAPYHLVLGRDGALALPPIPELREHQRVVEFFNRCLAALLLGGIYCEAITLDNLETGSIIDWKYIRVHSHAQGGQNGFHNLLRLRMAPPLEAIALLYPRTVTLAELHKAMAAGLAAINAVPPLSGEFLLKGTSGIARRDWGSGLSNLWIVIEQITEHLWQREVMAPSKAGDRIEGRSSQLKDTRTWTAATRQELLHQKGVIAPDTLRTLYVARRARNDLFHRGDHPTETAAIAGYDAVRSLLRIALQGAELPLFRLNLADHVLSDPFKPREREALDPKYWIPIPKLPGEQELEIEEGRRE
jgi:hypothetical protein